MEHIKVSHPQRQLPPRPRSVVKHETVEEKRKREGGKREGNGGGTKEEREGRDRV